MSPAHNGATALEKIAQQRPDLVLLDLQMPALGGLEVVRSLKRGTHMPAIVMVTAYDQYALQAFDAGAIDYLLKPVSQERLTEAVERARRMTSRETAERIGQLQEIAEPQGAPRTRRIVGRVGESIRDLPRQAVPGTIAQ